jgi:hypothetical protein
MTTIRLKEFDISKVSNNAICICIGRRQSGKSVLARDIVKNVKSIVNCTVISPTAVESNNEYQAVVPNISIYTRYDPKITEAHIVNNSNTESCLVLDDCFFDDSWRDESIQSIFTRKIGLCIMTIPYPYGMPDKMKKCVDYVFLLREPNVSNRKNLYDKYGSVFPSFEVFCEIMDQCTENFGCIVIDNTSQSNILEDRVLTYKAIS